ncbi:NEDD8-conjugating protein ubc12, partial [Irineochytrium annulatum]
MADLDRLPKSISVTLPDPNDLMNFELIIRPDDGLYVGGVFRFTIKINSNYPYEPPKVLCVQKIYHPNIDLEGNICLNILREDWKPVLNLHSVLIGMQYLFLEPNPEDPLNKEAAAVMRADRNRFVNNINTSMKGGNVEGVSYDRVLGRDGRRGRPSDLDRRRFSEDDDMYGTSFAVTTNSQRSEYASPNSDYTPQGYGTLPIKRSNTTSAVSDRAAQDRFPRPANANADSFNSQHSHVAHHPSLSRTPAGVAASRSLTPAQTLPRNMGAPARSQTLDGKIAGYTGSKGKPFGGLFTFGRGKKKAAAAESRQQEKHGSSPWDEPAVEERGRSLDDDAVLYGRGADRVLAEQHQHGQGRRVPVNYGSPLAKVGASDSGYGEDWAREERKERVRDEGAMVNHKGYEEGMNGAEMDGGGTSGGGLDSSGRQGGKCLLHPSDPIRLGDDVDAGDSKFRNRKSMASLFTVDTRGDHDDESDDDDDVDE